MPHAIPKPFRSKRTGRSGAPARARPLCLLALVLLPLARAEEWAFDADWGAVRKIETRAGAEKALAELTTRMEQFDSWKHEMGRQISQIRDPTLRQQRMDQFTELYRSKGQVLGRYRNAVGKYLVDYANGGPSGSDYDARIRLSEGTKPSDPRHRGIDGDADAEGSANRVDKLLRNEALAKTAKRLGCKPEQLLHKLNMEFHVKGPPAKIASEWYHTEMKAQAKNMEFYLSSQMSQGQPCYKLQRTLDHTKKMMGAYQLSPEALMNDPARLQEMSKATSKMLSESNISNQKLHDCLRGTPWEGKPNQFRDMLTKFRAEGYEYVPEKLLGDARGAKQLKTAVERIHLECMQADLVQGVAELQAQKQKIQVARDKGNTGRANVLSEHYYDSYHRIQESVSALRDALETTLKDPRARDANVKHIREQLSVLESIQKQIAPLQGQQAVFGKAFIEFSKIMTDKPATRKQLIQILNDQAGKAPRETLDKLKKLQEEGGPHLKKLLEDPDFRKLLADLEATCAELDKPAAKSVALQKAKALVDRCQKRIDQLNSALRKLVYEMEEGKPPSARAKSIQSLMKGYRMAFYLKDAYAAWQAYERGGVPEMAVEIVRRRVPFVTSLVHGNNMMVAWEVVCMLCPEVGLLYGIHAVTWEMTQEGVDFYWQKELEMIENTLYRNAVFRLEGVTRYEQTHLGNWQLVQTEYGGKRFDRSYFLAPLEGRVPLDDPNVEVAIRLAQGEADPILRWLNLAMKRKPDLEAEYERRKEERWEALIAWWAGHTLERLEGRVKAEEAITRGDLLELMFELDRKLIALEVEDLVVERIKREYSGAEKLYLAWKNINAWVKGTTPYLEIQGDDAPKRVAQDIVEKEIRYLDAYRKVYAVRAQVEKETGLEGQRDDNLRLLTGPGVLSGNPEADAKLADKWAGLPKTFRAQVEAALLAIKRKYIDGATLDQGYDAVALEAIVMEDVWAEAWKDVFRHWTGELTAETGGYADTARLFGEKIKNALFLGTRDDVKLDEIQNLGGVIQTCRLRHLKKRDALYVEFEAFYATAGVTPVFIAVRETIAGQKTDRGITDAQVLLAPAGGSFENEAPLPETRRGLYARARAAAGTYTFRVTAKGYRGPAGEESGTGTLTVPPVKAGERPTPVRHTVWLQPDRTGLTVKVSDDRDTPVTHATVTLQGADAALRRQGIIVSDTVDSDGTVTFGDLWPGSYRLVAKAAGYKDYAGPLTAAGPHERGPSRPGELHRVRLAPFLSTLVIRVSERQRLTPVAEAAVTIGGETTLTDANGEAQFTEMRPITRGRLTAQKTGYAPCREEVDLLATADGQTIRKNVFLNAGVGLRVKVVLDREGKPGEPLPGAHVTLNHASRFADGTTGADGTVLFDDLPPDFVYVEASKPGYVTVPYQEVDLRDAEADAVREVTVRLVEGMKVTLFIKDERGDLVVYARATLDDGPEVAGPTGTVVFEPVRAGTHVFTAKADGCATAKKTYAAQPAEAPAGRDSLVIVLQPGRTIRVEARDDTPAHALVKGSRLTLYRDGAPAGSATGASHLFADLGPGTYHAQAAAGGYAPGRSPEVTFAARGGPMTHTLIVALAETGVSAILQVTVTGAPKPDSVYVRVSGPGGTFSDTGELGVFRGLSAGTYTISAGAPGMNKAATTRTLDPKEPGQVYRVALALSRLAQPQKDFVPLAAHTDVAKAMNRAAIAAGLRGGPGQKPRAQDAFAGLSAEKKKAVWVLGVAMGATLGGMDIDKSDLQLIQATVPDTSYQLGGSYGQAICTLSVAEYEDSETARRVAREWARLGVKLLGKRATLPSNPDQDGGFAEMLNYVAKSTAVEQRFVHFHGRRAMITSSRTVGELARYQKTAGHMIQWQQGKYVAGASLAAGNFYMGLSGSAAGVSVPATALTRVADNLYRELSLLETE
ncbi:MAG: hypothetical protein JXR37_14605 [Kiritimatiellae bacterium]|nr:hypothetical protein [Kiritimatiellia bacterium]